MVEAITNNTFRIGDTVLLIGDGSIHTISRLNHHKVQVDNAKWYNANQLQLAMGKPAKSLPSHKDRPRLPSAMYIEIMEGLGYNFSMSDLDDRIHVNADPITDVIAETIKTDMRDRGHIHTNVIESAWIAEAGKNKFHIVKDYLNTLVWDKQEHIAALSMKFDDKDNAFSVLFRRWMIGAVAKCFEAAQNPMLVLDGVQNLGKSYFSRWLCSPLPAMYIEAPINPDNKDDQLRLANKWIWEAGELGSTIRRADRESLKRFLTIEQVTVRPPYHHYDIVKPALASFIGTINNDGGFLDDPTGSRRFLSLSLTAIDWSYTDIDINQLWAEAMNAYRAGEPWQLEREEQTLSQEINKRYEVQDPLEDMILDLFKIDPEKTEDDKWWVSTLDILEVLHTHGWRLRTPRGEAMALSSTLQKLGVVKPANKIIIPPSDEQVRGYMGIQKKPTPSTTY